MNLPRPHAAHVASPVVPETFPLVHATHAPAHRNTIMTSGAIHANMHCIRQAECDGETRDTWRGLAREWIGFADGTCVADCLAICRCIFADSTGTACRLPRGIGESASLALGAGLLLAIDVRRLIAPCIAPGALGFRSTADVGVECSGRARLACRALGGGHRGESARQRRGSQYQ